MQEELHEITKRIQLLMSHYSLRDDGRVVVADFANKIKIGHQVLNRCFNIDKRSGKYPKPSEKIISAIKKSLPEVNADWLLTGEGEMLKSESNTANESAASYGEPGTFNVPLLPISAQGGRLSDFMVSVKNSDCEQIISPIKGVDFAITVFGDSMTPEFPNGCQVLIKRINEQSFIVFFFKQKTAYVIRLSLVGSEMCIRPRSFAAGPKIDGTRCLL